MADIQSATAEIRRGKKKIDRKKKPQDENIIIIVISSFIIEVVRQWSVLFHRATITRQSVRKSTPEKASHQN